MTLLPFSLKYWYFDDLGLKTWLQDIFTDWP